MTTLTEAIDTAVDRLRPGFDADGFDVSGEQLDVGGAEVVIHVVARPEACDDCLVPDASMAAIFEAAIGDAAGRRVIVKIDHDRRATRSGLSEA